MYINDTSAIKKPVSLIKNFLSHFNGNSNKYELSSPPIPYDNSKRFSQKLLR
jgi:hypothetical protein